MSWATDFLHSFMIIDDGIWDERNFLAVVQDLCSYSLMSTSGGSDLSIHLLVQDWARNMNLKVVKKKGKTKNSERH